MPFKSSKNRENRSDGFELTEEAQARIDLEFPDEEEKEICETDGGRSKRRSKRWLVRIILWIVLLCFGVTAVNVAVLFYTGTFKLNEPRKRDYPVRGVYFDGDQGELNWTTVEKQNVTFAYMIATKGKSYTDKSFEKNWESAEKSELLTGAVHDFDFKSDGKKQGKNFCAAMGESISGRLVPAVDIRTSVWEKITSRDKQAAVERLEDFLEYVQEYYGCSVVIICDKYSYETYAAGLADDCMIWCESTLKKIDYAENWNIWQYSNRGKFDGCEKSGYCSLLTAESGMTVEEFEERFCV